MKEKLIKVVHRLSNNLAKLYPALEFMSEELTGDQRKVMDKVLASAEKVLEDTQEIKAILKHEKSQGLFHLSYVSSHAPSSDGLKVDTDRILANARVFNHDKNVTGVLVYRSGYFLQYLEGSKEDLFTVYGRICLDRRHKEIKLLSFSPIEERIFDGWDMGLFLAGHEYEDKVLDSIVTNFVNTKSFSSSDELISILSLFKSLKLQARRI